MTPSVKIKGMKMSFQERNVIASLFVGLMFFGLLYSYIHLPLREGGISAIGGFAAQAKLTLWFIGISIGANIICVIAFEIIYAIFTNTPNANQLVDERDRLIEINGDRYGNYLTGALFMASLLAAAWGTEPEWVLLYTTYAFFFGSALSSIIRLIQHRRGY